MRQNPVEVVDAVADTVIVKQPIIMQEQTIIKFKENKDEESEEEFNW